MNAWLRAGGDGIQKLGTVIRALHDGPAFPPFISVSQACLAVAASLERRGAAPPLARELLSRAEETRVALAPHLSEAPCHNDLNPGNIVVAGGRLWLVDWEAAGAGDPFHDLATPGVLLFHAPEQRAQLLRACLGREPSPVETARLALSPGLSLTLFALVFANVGSGRNGTPPPAPERVRDPVLNPAQFGAQLASEAERNYASTEHANALVLLR